MSRGLDLYDGARPIMFWWPKNHWNNREYYKRELERFRKSRWYPAHDADPAVWSGKSLERTPEQVRTIIDFLMNPVDKLAFRGFAGCRLCIETLGTHDYFGSGFFWPQKAEHYVMRHGVWIPEFDEILETHHGA